MCKMWLVLALSVLLPLAAYGAGVFETAMDPMVVANR